MNAPMVEDYFHRQSRAKALVRELLERTPASPEVWGVVGPWGSGKSTFLRFMRAELAELEPDVVAIDFNPWWFSSKEDIIRNFLRELGSISKTKLSNDGLASAFYFLSDVLALAPAVAGAGALAMGNAEIIASPEAQYIRGQLQQASKLGRRVGDKLSLPPSIEDLRTKMTEGLASSAKRIWVFIDDVDRLQRDEMLAMFSLLRSIGELPYIKYVVAVAFEGAEHSLESPNLVRSYAAKVFTDAYYLPQISPTQLQMYFAERLAQSWKAYKEFEQEYSRHVTEAFEVIPARFLTPRFMEQLSNATVRALETNQLGGEIALHDLILLETLRLCFNNVHSFVIEQSSWLVDSAADSAIDDLAGELNSRLDESLPEMSKKEREEALRILWSLFPKFNPSGAFYINRLGPHRAWKSAVLSAYLVGDADAAGVSQRRRKQLWNELGTLSPLGFNKQISKEPEDAYLALKEWIDQLQGIEGGDIERVIRYARAYYYSLNEKVAYNFLARTGILLTPFYSLERVVPDKRGEFLGKLIEESLKAAPVNVLVDLLDLLKDNQRMVSIKAWVDAESPFFDEIYIRAADQVLSAIRDGMRNDVSPRVLRAALCAWSPALSDALEELDAEAAHKVAAAALGVYQNASTIEHIEQLSPIIDSPVFDVMLQDETVKEALLQDKKRLQETQTAMNGEEGSDPDG